MPRGSSAWVIPCAFLVALASIAGIATLQVRVKSSRNAQVELVQDQRKFDALQSIPYDSIGQGAAGQTLVVKRIQATERDIERSVTALQRADGNADLAAAQAPYRANLAVLARITGLLAAGRQEAADPLGPMASRLQGVVNRHMGKASAEYAKLAAASLRLAAMGSSAAILALVSLFGLFYFRSRKAHARAQRLADENALILLQDSQLQVIHRLALAAEYRDDDTGQHTRRVGDLSARIGAELGVAEEQLKLLRQAAPLHDVGKIGIPDAILLKPGRLTTGEFDRMKAHTTLGAEMLAGGRELSLLAMAEEIALTHHERWEGSGYPAGLSGTAIPLVGRVVAVADVFDALTHPRPYKDAWTVNEAVSEILDQRGRQFDPDAVDAFMRVLPDLPPESGSDRETDATVDAAAAATLTAGAV
jgi:HD-GYP domain-containing protein (c-di-GMP phosphodiesterase class II)